MSGISLLWPILLGVFGLAVVFFLLKTLVQSVTIDLRGLTNRLKLQRKEKCLASADEAIGAGEFQKARSLLRDSFYIGGEFESFAFLEKINSHNIETLERILSISEQHSAHFNNLPLIEGLFQSRLELFKSLLDITQAREKVKSKQKEKGKDAPDWAFEEFSRKIQEIRDRLDANKKSLESQLNDLFSDFKNLSQTNEITYH